MKLKSKLAAVSVQLRLVRRLRHYEHFRSATGIACFPRVAHFKIEEDVSAGFYVYAFEGEKCTHDSLQDTLALAKECAREEFGVPEPANRQAFRCVVLGFSSFSMDGFQW